MINWKMNGKEYAGRLKATDIAQLEEMLGCGIVQALQTQQGVRFTMTALMLAARHGAQGIKQKDFTRDFEAECEASTLMPMQAVAVQLLQASGVISAPEEAEEKKD